MVCVWCVCVGCVWCVCVYAVCVCRVCVCEGGRDQDRETQREMKKDRERGKAGPVIPGQPVPALGAWVGLRHGPLGAGGGCTPCSVRLSHTPGTPLPPGQAFRPAAPRTSLSPVGSSTLPFPVMEGKLGAGYWASGVGSVQALG